MTTDVAELLLRSRELLDSALSKLDAPGVEPAPVTPQRDWGAILQRRLDQVREEVVIAISEPISVGLEYLAAEAQIRELVDAGIRVQILLSARYADDRELAARLRACTFADRIRVTDNDFHNTMVLDRRIAVLWARVNGQPQAHVASEYTLMGAIYQFATQTWATALPLRDHLALRHRELDDTTLAVLRLLNDGVTDEVAARRLSVSTRTYRRCIAELMTRLGVATRFQLGARAAELGLLRSSSG